MKMNVRSTDDNFRKRHSMSAGFDIPIIEKKKKPVMKNTVSSLFATASKKNVDKEEKKKIEISKDIAEKDIKKKRNELKPKEEKPISPFLKVLNDRLNKIPPKKPVPTPKASGEEVPVIGFGEVMLKKQGWEPGDPISQK